MKRNTWRKHHKWLGILFCLFMLMFCLSGIILNHRQAVSHINVERGWLPERYHYKAWNSGLMRGTTKYTGKDSVSCILVYGTGGIWKTDKKATSFSDFNKGLPDGADYRQIKSIVQTSDKDLYTVSIFGLYRYDGKECVWQSVNLPKGDEELLTDAICSNDTLVVLGRSYLYVSVTPYTSFRKIQLKEPTDYKKEVTLFRTVWTFHSGELFGMTGRIVVDMIAVILILLCVTGLMLWLLPKYVKEMRKRGGKADKALWLTRISLLWHNKLGRTTIVFTLFIAITGWCLRPPVMLPLVLNKVPAVPGTVLDSDNPWNDKLRMIRYDKDCGDWLISTSEGFYSLNNLEGIPARIGSAPPVSVMGINVFQKDKSGKWLCGSFSGLYVWNRQKQTVKDYFTHETLENVSGPPFGKRAISGYSSDFNGHAIAVEYYKGTDAIVQPEKMEYLPMSLWNFALEVHSGRIYMGNIATYIFVFFAGIVAVWCLWSGWKIRKQGKRQRSQ